VDEEDAPARIKKATEHLQKKGIRLKSAELVYCLQDACIETWFLGNRTVFKRNPGNKTLSEFIQFYDVYRDDPELMYKPPKYNGERQQFHKHYWKLIARERRMRYRETSPGATASVAFLESLQSRVKDSRHLPALTRFLGFWMDLEDQLHR
jgi:hypothetical protein